MADDETEVKYKAIVDFTQLSLALAKAKKDLRDLKAEEKRYNDAAVAGNARVKKSFQEKTNAIKAANRATESHVIAQKKLGDATDGVRTKTNSLAKAVRDKTVAVKNDTNAVRSNESATKRAGTSTKSFATQVRATITAVNNKKKALDAATTSTNKHSTAAVNSSSAERAFGTSLKNTATKAKSFKEAFSDVIRQHSLFQRANSRSSSSTVRFRRSVNQATGEVQELPRVLQRASVGAGRFSNSLRRLGNWRPRFIPPFIALIPAVAGALAALNPLVSLFGAAGGAAIGLASSLGSLAGAALALPGILGAVAGGVSALLASFSGIGGAFKAFSAMQKAGGGGGGGGGGAGGAYVDQAREIERATQDVADAQEDLGRAYEDAAENIADAEKRYTRAQKDATKAQEELNDARTQALRDLQDLRKEVSRAGLDEERAIANLTQAQEDYYNVLADPGSTLGDKQDALASVHEAEQDLIDVREEAKRNAEDLAEAEAKGVEGSDQVVDAKERLVDALDEENDAYRDLQRARKDESRSIQDATRRLEDAYDALRKAQEGQGGGGGGGGGGGVADAFQEALDKLSPSAQAFVLGILSMKDAWDAMKKSVQETFFSRIVGDLETMRGLIPNIGVVLNKFAAVLGDFAHEAINLFASAEWQRDFLQFGDDGSQLLKEMGRGGLALATALKDIMMAAAPFTQWLVSSLATGAENFRDLVASGRESGALASWLDKVRSRLEQWWRIIKNVATTLFNYGAAAGDFGKWITDGLEALTEGWLGSSEEANKENSKFKQWLEDIKPVLSELKQLAADFFGWFTREASDKNNLKQMQDILETIRTDLGPAITDLLDNLSKSGLGEDLLDTLTTIVQAISDVVDAGGGEGFKVFFDILKEFFSAVSEFVKTPGVGDVLKGIGTALGVIAGLSFIGKFTGLTNLLSWIIRAAGTPGAIEFLGALGGIGGGTLAAGAAGPVVAHIANQGAAGAIEQQGPGENQTQEQFEGGVNRIRSDVGSTVGSSIGTKSVIDPFAGGGDWDDVDLTTPVENALKDIGDLFGDSGPWAQAADDLQSAWDGFVSWLGDLWQGVVDWWNDGWAETIGEFQHGWEQIQQWWADTNKAFTDGWNAFVAWLGEIWNGFVTWLSDVWNGIVDLWNGFLGWLGDVWNGIVQVAMAVWSFIQSLWAGAVDVAKGIWAVVQSWWSAAVDAAKGIWNTVQQWWGDAVNTAKNIWDNVSRWFQDAANGIGGFFSGIYDGIVGAVRGAFNGVSSFLSGIFGNIGGLVPPTKPGPVTQTPSQADRNDAATNAAKPSVAGPRGGHYSRGGEAFLQHFAGGGRTLKKNNGSKPFRQIGTDTVPAMLTPGEFILKKSIVDAIGVDNLQRLNSGMVSYADMLRQFTENQKTVDKQREKPKQEDAGLSFFNGGGLAADRRMAALSLGSNVNSSALASTQTVVNHDEGLTIENLNINNPVPEPSSDSLPNAIRKVAYIGNARGSRP